MANRWSVPAPQESRWSSAREREAREAKEASERVDAGRAPRADAPAPPAVAGGDEGPVAGAPDSAAGGARPQRRRMSEDDRDAIRRWRSPRPEAAEAAGPRVSATTEPAALPDLPDIFEEDAAAAAARPRSGRLGNRALILGGLLFLGMAAVILPAMAFPGFGPGDDPTPTPTELIAPRDGRQVLAAATPQATRPVATDGATGIVCLDAGHGGWDPGFPRLTTTGAPQMDEAAINLGMAWMLKERLEAEGFEVVMTRRSGGAVNSFYQDVNGDGQTAQIGSDGKVTKASKQVALRDELQARINICNEAGADILLSMHLNGFSDAKVRGYEVIYTAEREFADRSFDLATYVDRQLKAHFDESGFQTEARGVKKDTDVRVNAHGFGSERHLIMIGPAVPGTLDKITPSEMPGVVIEPLFISNDADAAFLAETENQQTIVDAYAAAILQYFDKHPAES